MSRSYKHTPYVGDKKGKFKKRLANKKVRNFLKNNKDFSTKNKKFFRKIFETYEICDFYWIMNFKKFSLFNKKFFSSEKDMYRYWYTRHKSK